jgi:hypothetical protein
MSSRVLSLHSQAVLAFHHGLFTRQREKTVFGYDEPPADNLPGPEADPLLEFPSEGTPTGERCDINGRVPAMAPTASPRGQDDAFSGGESLLQFASEVRVSSRTDDARRAGDGSRDLPRANVASRLVIDFQSRPSGALAPALPRLAVAVAAGACVMAVVGMVLWRASTVAAVTGRISPPGEHPPVEVVAPSAGDHRGFILETPRGAGAPRAVPADEERPVRDPRREPGMRDGPTDSELVQPSPQPRASAPVARTRPDDSNGSDVSAGGDVEGRRTNAPAAASRFRGSLSVTSSPEGAQVFLNDAFVGLTPLVLRDVPGGSRVVRIELDGHARWSSSVQIVANEQTAVAAVLISHE